MKSISLILAALLCSTSPLLADDRSNEIVSTQVQEAKLSMGTDFVQAVRVQYANGDYFAFLQQMGDDYSAAKDKKSLDGLIEIRKEDALIASSYAQKDVDHWNEMARSWMQERNSDLLKAVEGLDDLMIAQKVQSVVKETDPKLEEAANYLFDLRKLSPGEGRNADENRLIDLNLELEYKQIHLNALVMNERSILAQHEKQLALQMEHMDQLLAISQDFQDQEIKENVALIANTFDARYAKSVDLRDLKDLGRGKIVPSNETEKKVASIVSSYAGKFTDLVKETF
jgi:hypothetical protein